MFLTLFALLTVHSARAADVGVSPAWVDIAPEAGVTSRFSIVMTNDGNRDRSFVVETVDLLLDPETFEVAYEVDPTSTWSVRPYLEIPQRIIVIPPMETREINVVVQLPPDVVEAKYGALSIKSTPYNAEPGSGAAAMELGLGFIVPIMIRTASSAPDLRVDEFSASGEANSGTVEATVTLTNSGSVHSRPTLDLAIRDSESGLVHATTSWRSLRIILPGQTTSQTFDVPVDLNEGTYQLLGAMGTPSMNVPSVPLSGELTISAAPPPASSSEQP